MPADPTLDFPLFDVVKTVPRGALDSVDLCSYKGCPRKPTKPQPGVADLLPLAADVSTGQERLARLGNRPTRATMDELLKGIATVLNRSGASSSNNNDASGAPPGPTTPSPTMNAATTQRRQTTPFPDGFPDDARPDWATRMTPEERRAFEQRVRDREAELEEWVRTGARAPAVEPVPEGIRDLGELERLIDEYMRETAAASEAGSDPEQFVDATEEDPEQFVDATDSEGAPPPTPEVRGEAPQPVQGLAQLEEAWQQLAGDIDVPLQDPDPIRYLTWDDVQAGFQEIRTQALAAAEGTRELAAALSKALGQQAVDAAMAAAPRVARAAAATGAATAQAATSAARAAASGSRAVASTLAPVPPAIARGARRTMAVAADMAEQAQGVASSSLSAMRGFATRGQSPRGQHPPAADAPAPLWGDSAIAFPMRGLDLIGPAAAAATGARRAAGQALLTTADELEAALARLDRDLIQRLDLSGTMRFLEQVVDVGGEVAGLATSQVARGARDLATRGPQMRNAAARMTGWIASVVANQAQAVATVLERRREAIAQAARQAMEERSRAEDALARASQGRAQGPAMQAVARAEQAVETIDQRYSQNEAMWQAVADWQPRRPTLFALRNALRLPQDHTMADVEAAVELRSLQDPRNAQLYEWAGRQLANAARRR
jgi:hypothetical protein